LKAIVYTEYGGPQALRMAEVKEPTPAPDEVLVKVCAVSVNDWDYAMLHGDWVNRLMNGLRRPKRQIVGSDVAGRVVTMGADAKKFRIGDEVFGDLSGRWGGFAEYVCAPENMLALKSPAMSFEQAAAIPQAGMLAVQALLDKGQIQTRKTLLINGAGGGVGTFGIQIAKQFGVEITAVDSVGKLPMLKALGVHHTIDYRREDFTRNGKQYDLILDVKTNRSIYDYRRVLSPSGMYATVGGEYGALFQTFAFGSLATAFSDRQLKVVALKQNKDLLYFNGMFESGKVIPVLDGPYTLEEVPAVFRIFGRGDHKGKMVVTVGK
jgi:NADPH:quinone reductase-like Zn-dependent oxidoreductase